MGRLLRQRRQPREQRRERAHKHRTAAQRALAHVDRPTTRARRLLPLTAMPSSAKKMLRRSARIASITASAGTPPFPPSTLPPVRAPAGRAPGEVRVGRAALAEGRGHGRLGAGGRVRALEGWGGGQGRSGARGRRIGHGGGRAEPAVDDGLADLHGHLLTRDGDGEKGECGDDESDCGGSWPLYAYTASLRPPLPRSRASALRLVLANDATLPEGGVDAQDPKESGFLTPLSA
ncbi:hypothetical protein HWV62_29338 [Athelia sp. TMB]|nr:hypothetical protein HWV62_29338 [Athelia sp. TMB]